MNDESDERKHTNVIDSDVGGIWLPFKGIMMFALLGCEFDLDINKSGKEA